MKMMKHRLSEVPCDIGSFMANPYSVSCIAFLMKLFMSDEIIVIKFGIC